MPKVFQYPYLVLVLAGLIGSVLAPILPFAWFFCKWHARDRRELLHQVRSFSFENAQCQEENDRIYVRERIEEWFGAVAPFERHVQTDLAQHIEGLLQQQGPVPYRVMIIGNLGGILTTLTTMFNSIQDGMPGQFNLWAGWLTICFFAIPCAFSCMMRLADTRFDEAAAGGSFLRRWLAGPAVFTLVLSSFIAVAAGLLTPAAPAWLAALIFALEALVTTLLFCPRRALQ